MRSLDLCDVDRSDNASGEMHLGMCTRIPADREFGRHRADGNFGSLLTEKCNLAKIVQNAHANARNKFMGTFLLIPKKFADTNAFCLK
jgi:hypothetical protein